MITTVAIVIGICVVLALMGYVVLAPLASKGTMRNLKRGQSHSAKDTVR